MGEQLKSANPDETEKSKEMDVLYAKTFSSMAGRKVLAHLRDITIERPNLQITNGIAGILTGYVMEGRSSLVRDIEKRIKIANTRGVKPIKPKAVP